LLSSKKLAEYEACSLSFDGAAISQIEKSSKKRLTFPKKRVRLRKLRASAQCFLIFQKVSHRKERINIRACPFWRQSFQNSAWWVKCPHRMPFIINAAVAQ